MPNLETTFMNLKLGNPIIVASSGLTKNEDKIKACEDAGAGAVVVKSLFEEALAMEDYGIAEAISFHTEAYDYLRAELEKQYGPQEYGRVIYNAKKRVSIPVIASVNCVSAKWWPSYAKQIEAAGADALELNVFNTPLDPEVKSNDVEKLYYDILEEVTAKIKIPVAMKIGTYFSALPHFAGQLAQRGAKALVLFNRFAEPDINIKTLRLRTTFSYSKKEEIHRPLKWIAILSDKVPCDLAGTTGVHNAEGMIKLLLAGAKAVQIASLLYKSGIEEIAALLKEMENWMTEHQFSRIDDFRGKLALAKIKNPDVYLRAQFLEKIRGID